MDFWVKLKDLLITIKIHAEEFTLQPVLILVVDVT
jgi:hypothetical protein